MKKKTPLFGFSYKKKNAGPIYKRKTRSQKVKFRRRYASSVIQKSLISVWSIVKVTILTLVISGGSVFLWQTWNTSPHLKLDKVIYRGDIPADLKKFLSFRKGENILLMRVRSLEKAGRSEFPELKNLRISRNFDRAVTVQAEYRVPLARWGQSREAIDSEGVIFPISSAMSINENLPTLVSEKIEDQAKDFAVELTELKTALPAFYDRINQIKIDRIDAMILTLADGIVVNWGRLEAGTTVARAKKVLKILENFKPQKKDASMRFVEDDRIVIDQYWKQNS